MMGTLTEKRPEAGAGPVKMSARHAMALVRRAKRRGAKVEVKDSRPALAKPATGMQKKSGCSLCSMAGGSPETAPAGYSCPLCKAGGSPSLAKPSDSVQTKGAGTSDPAETQADSLGAAIGADLGAAGHVSSGPLPASVQGVAERHLGVGLGGTEIRGDAGAHARTASVGALAVAEGSTISFGAGQLSTSTDVGRSLLGHELTHVAQQRAHGTEARQGFLGLDDVEEEGGGGEIQKGLVGTGSGGQISATGVSEDVTGGEPGDRDTSEAREEPQYADIVCPREKCGKTKDGLHDDVVPCLKACDNWLERCAANARTERERIQCETCRQECGAWCVQTCRGD